MASRSWWERWYRNIPFWILLVVMSVVALVAVYTYTAYRRAAIDLILERNQQLAVLSAARLHEELSNFANSLEILAKTNEMSDGNEHNQSEALSSASPRLAVFDGGVVLLDERGAVTATEPKRVDILGQDWSNRAYFQAVLADAQIFISNSLMDGVDDSLVIAVSVPIHGGQEEFEGALVGMFRLGEPALSAFYASIVRLRLGQSGGTYVVDSTGRILYDSESDRVGRFVTTEQLPLVASGKGASVELTKDFQGRDIVAARAPVPNTSWMLIIEDDWTILTRSPRLYSSILLLSFAIALALPPLSLVILSRQRRFPLLDPNLPSHGDFIAREIHRELHRKVLPTIPGWTLSQRCKPGKIGGRDFFDACILLDGRLMLSMGRVEAEGIQAGLALASTRSALRVATLQGLEPCQALQQCNRVLCAEYSQPIDVRCLYLLLDPSSGNVEYSGAGFARPYFYGKDRHQETQRPGTPMGLTTELYCETRESRLDKGEGLVLLSDFMLEARNKLGENFGETYLASIMRDHQRSAEALTNAIFSAFKSFYSDGRAPTDDANIIVLMRNAHEPLESA
ncbi:MAG: SpoIIE family protein phosphatase [Anaerolineales bacterium]|nr:SpoIIE family protein phosphatase [Anaerolineales bacterium]